MKSLCSKMAFRKWLLSPAGKCLLVLGASSFILSAIALWIDANTFLSNTLIGLATNSFGILITISFVQHYINISNDAISARHERERFLRSNRFAEILIDRYALGYYAVTHPLSNRHNDDCRALDTNVEFKALQDMFGSCGLIFSGVVEPAIDVFYEAERELRGHFQSMLDNTDFIFSPEICDCIVEFVKVSRSHDVKRAVLGARHTRVGNKLEYEDVKASIVDEKQDWCKMFRDGNLKSNMMTPYVVFYYMILREAELLKKYKTLVAMLRNNIEQC